MIWVVVEAPVGLPETAMLQAIGCGHRLGARVEAISWDRPAPARMALLGEHGVAALQMVGDGSTELGLEAGAEFARRIGALASRHPPDAVVLPSTRAGRDLAGRLAAALDAPVVGGVEAVGHGPGLRLRLRSTVLGGAFHVDSEVPSGGPVVLLLHPGYRPPVAAPGGLPAIVDRRGPPAGRDARLRLVERMSRAGEEGPSLEEARIIMSGGAGLGAAGFELLHQAAALLGGAVGASRAAIDAGWAPAGALIGQSGRSVSPEVYVACGISGAPQHVCGMREARRVIAINRDPSAAIFGVADLGIVGDAKVVLTKLLRELRDG